MKIASIVTVSLLNLIIAIRYCRLIIMGKIKPSLAMWTFFSIGVIGSLITYFLDNNSYGIQDNILNATDVLLVTSVSIIIFIYGDKSTRFNRFDMGCLFIVSLIILIWIFTQKHFLANVSIQTIQAIAYAPVIRRLWTSNKNTESFFIWICMFLATSISLLSSKGLLALLYSTRALFCITILLFLMLRLKFKKVHQSEII